VEPLDPGDDSEGLVSEEDSVCVLLHRRLHGTVFHFRQSFSGSDVVRRQHPLLPVAQQLVPFGFQFCGDGGEELGDDFLAAASMRRSPTEAMSPPTRASPS
jgi:hypothetical protein